RRARDVVLAVLEVVGLEAVLAATRDGCRSLDREAELVLARVAELPVEVVVARGRRHDELRADGPAEPLDRVVEAVVSLETVEVAGTADTVEGDGVELVVRAQLEAREFHADEAHEPARVVVVVTAEGDAVQTFGEALLGLARVRGVAVDLGAAVELDAAP